jgi:hypothetical protein
VLQPSDARGRVKAGSRPAEGNAELVTSGVDFDAIQRGIRAKYGVMVPGSRISRISRISSTISAVCQKHRAANGLPPKTRRRRRKTLASLAAAAPP